MVRDGLQGDNTKMPVHVEKRPVKGGKDYAIVETATGKIKGRSETKGKAESSARARNAGMHGWKGTYPRR